MARQKGTANFSGTLEVQAGGPIDSRTIVPTKADLTVASNFQYAYVGMETYVTAENKKYRLIGDDITDLNNWEEVGSDKVSKEAGKGLSTNDYTTSEKEKLQGLSNYDDTEVRSLINGKQNKLTAGPGIEIDANNVISSNGGGSVTVDDTLSMTSSNPVQNRVITNALQNIGPLRTNVLYAFKVNDTSNPYDRIQYLEDCKDFLPAYMDFANGKFEYGSWKNTFFIPKPCMLASNGEVDYYLKENDFTKKANGADSDVANASYDGNAMMEWGSDGRKIWYKIVPADSIGYSYTVYIADGKLDEGFVCWPFVNNQGVESDHFYTAIYNGSVISNKMRSLSGQQAGNLRTAEQEITAARLNNPSGSRFWDIETFSDRQLIIFLTWLISHSTNSQAKFGQGLSVDGTEAINNSFRTGVHNAKGLFFGTNSGAAATYSNAVKIFGMENFYGFQWRRIQGYINRNGDQMVKLTKGTEDGSTASDFNLDGTGYISIGNTPSGTSGELITKMKAIRNSVIPVISGGTNYETYYGDGLWFKNEQINFAHVGGASNNAARVGTSCWSLSDLASGASWNDGAALSCKK